MKIADNRNKIVPGDLKSRPPSLEKFGNRFSSVCVAGFDRSSFRFVLTSESSRKEKLKSTIRSTLDSKWYSLLITLVTLYALLGDDFRLALTHLSMDPIFFSLASFVLAIFTLEFVASTYSRPGYVGSFYFYLDLISILSLVPDIGWMWDPFLIALSTGSSTSSNLENLHSGNVSRTGARAGQIVRLVRLIRLVRIAKLYKMSKGGHTSDMETEIDIEPSKVGKQMSEITTRRIIIIVFVIAFVIPFLDLTLNENYSTFQLYGITAMHRLATFQNVETDVAFRVLLTEYIKSSGSLIFLNISNVSKNLTDTWLKDIRFQPNGDTTGNFTDLINPITKWKYENMLSTLEEVFRNYRTIELRPISIVGCFNASKISDGNHSCQSIAIFDNSSVTQNQAEMNICKTFFIMFIIGFAAVAFARIAEILVIGPIERMMDLVKRLAQNPLASTLRTEGAALKHAQQEGYETALLETTLSKIGALMQVGFGAAGADIIGKNMGSGDLDPMLPGYSYHSMNVYQGKKITAIYGFCDIRQFTDTTECLQEEVMVYVNKLGEIIHGGTHSYYGTANKNVGDAFLLSWKICNGILPGFSSFEDIPTEEMRLRVNETFRCPPNPGTGIKSRRITPTEMAESALTAFLKCYIDLDNANTDGCLTEYLHNERVINRFGPSFRIKMGFGMHVGWAIEGAIGSKYKIDATYVSPHVQMADRLEAGSKMFNAPINLSHWFVALLSPDARKYLRKMDRIQVSGASQPMTVYTFDVTNMKIGFGSPKMNADGEQVPVDFEQDTQYAEIQEGLHPGFLSKYNSAFEEYLNGNWDNAKSGLLDAMNLKENDGPSNYLLGIMKTHGNICPSDWSGYRQVDKY